MTTVDDRRWWRAHVVLAVVASAVIVAFVFGLVTDGLGLLALVRDRWHTRSTTTPTPS